MNPRQRRAVLLLALAFAGLLGVFALVANYVADVNTQVGPKVSVLELTKPVEANQVVDDDMVIDKLIPKRWAPKSALTDRTQLTGYVAGTKLSANSILEEGMLVTPPEIRPGEREVAILVDASTGVAGKITANRLVDVVAAYPADDQRKRPARPEGVGSGARGVGGRPPPGQGGHGGQDG